MTKLNFIAVDDEQHALFSIRKLVNSIFPNSSITCFSYSKDAILYAESNQVDVAFLDIEMYDMNGIALAKELKDIYSKTNIIFVTGHSSYAIDAFSVAASYYLLKPVSADKVEKAIAHLRHPIINTQPPKLYAQTFGNFEVFADGIPIKFTRSKTKELFAYLISRHGIQCSNSLIISVIWEHEHMSPSIQSHFRHLVSDLTTTLKGLALEDAIIKKRGSIAIDPTKISCDLYDFCSGNPAAINSYMGEFMSQYSWAEFTNINLSKP